MSTTFSAPVANALDDLPWIEVDGDVGDAYEQFAAAADQSIARRNAPRGVVVIAEEARALAAGPGLATYAATIAYGAAVDAAEQDRAAYESLLEAQNTPLINDEADDDAYLQATDGYAEPVAKPLPSD
jgi:hypothetical protein